MRQFLPALACIALVALAGCGTAPPVSDTPTADLQVSISNDHDRTYVVSIGVAPGGHRGLAVEFVNGSERVFPAAGSPGAIPQPALSDAIAVYPVGNAVRNRTYRVPASRGVGESFENVSRNATVYYSVGTPGESDPLRSLGAVRCGPEVGTVEFTLDVNAEGSIAVSNRCSD